jgi:hypothetical protein
VSALGLTWLANVIRKPKALIMLKGFAIAAICIGTLVTLHYNVYGGIYTDQVLKTLRQIGYSFGY